jgi:hypothetical protein
MKKILLLLGGLLALSACGSPGPITGSATGATPRPTDLPTPSSEVAQNIGGAVGHEWPQPLPPVPAYTRAPVSPEEAEALELLQNQRFAPNDPIALAVAVQGRPVPGSDPVEPDLPEIGDLRTFWVLNQDMNAWAEIEAELVQVSEHAYFWLDTQARPAGPVEWARAATGFDEIYQAVRSLFGSEASPGIDGDRRVYIVHVSPAVLCAPAESCGLLGYSSSTDRLPVEILPQSNEHEMFVMNAGVAIGASRYLSVLAHEFRHMIEASYDTHSEGWEGEGTATLAQILVGDTIGPEGRANAYLANTDLQLNDWPEIGTHPHYGKGYVFSRYLLDRFGQEFFTTWVQHPESGLSGLDAALSEAGIGMSALDVWVDFTAAVSLIGHPGVPEAYRFSPDFRANAHQPAGTLQAGAGLTESVAQFGFDTYRLEGQAPLQVTFSGTLRSPVMAGQGASSGQFFWWSGRSNQADMSLTRAVDLTGAAEAALEYDVLYDTEYGFDYAYVLVSLDEGRSWEALRAPGMQRRDAGDDPTGVALTDSFYTGESGGWIRERVDLAPYLGQVVLLRFQYVTDAVINQDGFAVDNIAVPEIGFFDDGEELDDGWQAVGFMRLPAAVPQVFHLVLITFEGGAARIERVPMGSDNLVAIDVPLSPDSSQAYLVVTAATPIVRGSAAYVLEAGPAD